MSRSAQGTVAVPPVPGVWRRMACFIYEGVLLFGVSLVSGAVAAAVVATVGEATVMRHQALLGVIGFVVYGLYFCGFWTRRGQTLAMQTWNLRLETVSGERVSLARAVLRYLAAYVWLVPAVVVARLNGWSGWSMLLAVAVGILAWAALARLHPQRQFLHDAVCGTRLVHWQTPRRSHSAKLPAGQNPAP